VSQGEYTIEAVSDQTRPYPSQYGDMVVYWVKLKDTNAEVPAGAFELHKKASSKPPEVGHTVEVERFERGQHNDVPFIRIRPLFRQQGGRGGGGRGYDDPETIARITRSHSQEMALRFVAATDAASALNPEETASRDAFLAGVLKPLIDWFDSDVQGAAKSAKGQDGQQPVSFGGEVPADGTGLSNGSSTAAATADDQIPF
jgi:hypothetical protein